MAQNVTFSHSGSSSSPCNIRSKNVGREFCEILSPKNSFRKPRPYASPATRPNIFAGRITKEKCPFLFRRNWSRANPKSKEHFSFGVPRGFARRWRGWFIRPISAPKKSSRSVYHYSTSTNFCVRNSRIWTDFGGEPKSRFDLRQNPFRLRRKPWNPIIPSQRMETTQTKTKCVLYARKSTEEDFFFDQQIMSIEAQLFELREYAEQRTHWNRKGIYGSEKRQEARARRFCSKCFSILRIVANLLVFWRGIRPSRP